MQKLSPVLLLFFLTSCTQTEEKLPIEDGKLVLTLADIHIAEAAIQNMTSSAKDTLSYNYYEQVYEIHGTNKETIDSAMAVLHRNPQKFYDIYEKVRVELEQKAAESLQAKTKKKNDKEDS